MTEDKILIITHKPEMELLLHEVFAKTRGFVVIRPSKGEDEVRIAAIERPALIIMDVAKADEMSGFESLQRIREFSDVPIILLTHCDNVGDALLGFELGADDYMSMPIDPKLLLARVRVLLKRCQSQVDIPAEIVCNDLVIDLVARRVIRRETEIYLTDTEYKLLLELARHRNRVLMHEQILVAVWGREYCNEVGYLRSYIHILRRKLEYDPAQPRLIVSRPGIGYMLNTFQQDTPGE